MEEEERKKKKTCSIQCQRFSNICLLHKSFYFVGKYHKSWELVEIIDIKVLEMSLIDCNASSWV